jgi:glycosyltransferase involved in cell wall biosynthesis
MNASNIARAAVLSVVVPCYNEAGTLRTCLERVMAVQTDWLRLEVIVVDDCSTDESLAIAEAFAGDHPGVKVVRHPKNQGKGAALRTGFRHATGDVVAIQDADLEYDPRDLKRMLEPIINQEAEVVFGTRFSLSGAHRVLYFWHYIGNRFLTLLSDMFTDLNLTDMECCYKVFRREVIQAIRIEETRFGIEPELVAKVAQMRLRIYEMGVSYAGRTYEEGKKIGVRDGFRALYCILRYNAFKAPVPVQLALYTGIAGVAAVVNITFFLLLRMAGIGDAAAILMAYFPAALLDYVLCVGLLFRHRARWAAAAEGLWYLLIVGVVGVLDFGLTRWLLDASIAPFLSKSAACLAGLAFNFIGRRYVVFPEPPAGPWKSTITQ